MEAMSFRERNRLRRERNAFENLYAYARDTGVSDPKRTAERTARRVHAEDGRAGRPRRSGGGVGNGRRGASNGEARAREVPHRLDDRTRDQLYARAQELDIEGRSSMTKDELVEAIRARQ